MLVRILSFSFRRMRSDSMVITACFGCMVIGDYGDYGYYIMVTMVTVPDYKSYPVPGRTLSLYKTLWYWLSVTPPSGNGLTPEGGCVNT